MAKFFVYPFAVNGDKTAIPDPLQGGGSVSYYQGWGPDYGLDLTSGPPALPIPRDSMNELFYDITNAIQQYQTHGVPDFITTADNLGTPYSYDIYAQVRYDDGSGFKVYENQVQGNTALPTDPSWAVISGSPIPPGVIWPYGGTVLPTGGWFFCNGALVDRITYAALFAVIGTNFGAGDGSTTFQLPNTPRRVLMGAGGTGSAIIGNAVGNIGGAEGVALTAAQNGEHTHAAVPGYTYHGVKDGSGRLGFTTGGPAQTGGVNGGAGQAHPNIQPSLITNFIIKY